jgi:hypothetical protein
MSGGVPGQVDEHCPSCFLCSCMVRQNVGNFGRRGPAIPNTKSVSLHSGPWLLSLRKDRLSAAGQPGCISDARCDCRQPDHGHNTYPEHGQYRSLFKLGHRENQTRPLRVEPGQHPGPAVMA